MGFRFKDRKARVEGAGVQEERYEMFVREGLEVLSFLERGVSKA